MEPTLTPKLAPYLAVRDAEGLIRFIERAVGGRLSFRESDAEGRVTHAEVAVQDSVVMVADVPGGRSPFPAMMHLYVGDSDAAYEQALGAGASSVRAPTNSPDGNRRGGVRDPWGNEWWFSSPIGKRSDTR